MKTITIYLPQYQVDRPPDYKALGKVDKKRDGFVFKDPAKKTEALLGVVKITD